MKYILVVISLLPLTACFSVATSAATEGVIIARQERSVGNAVDDAGIYLQLKKLYADKDAHDLFANVEIKVVEGRVLLTGNIDKAENQIEAVKLAWTVPGVREVMNEIQLNDKSDFMNYANDVFISTQVRGRLLLAKDIHSVNYSVITVNGTVYLMGLAENQAELDRATYLASVTRGVNKVISHVKLYSDPSRRD